VVEFLGPDPRLMPDTHDEDDDNEKEGDER
jgi:hypothetical protein